MDSTAGQELGPRWPRVPKCFRRHRRVVTKCSGTSHATDSADLPAKLILLALVLFGLGVSILPPSATAQVPDDFLIVPGQRIGPYRLGAPYAFFVEAWGDNDLGAGRERQWCPGQRFAWTVKPMGYIAEFWKDVAVWVGIYSPSHPNYPERDALASRYRTEKGVRLGSAFSAVERAHGKPDQEGRVVGWTFWYYKSGLRLLFVRGEYGEGKAVEIDVMPAGTVLTNRALLPCPPITE